MLLVPKLPKLPSSRTLSQAETDPVNRMTNTIVKPPLLAMLKVRDPASRYCDLVLSKLTWPLPIGPPAALYVGTVPKAALFLVDIEENEGLGVRAMNLAQAVVEYDAMTFVKPDVQFVIFCGLLFSPQQSSSAVVPESARKPAGHSVQTEAALAAYVFAGHTLHAALPEMLLAAPAAHATHGPTFGPLYPALHEQSLSFLLPNIEFAFAVQLVHAALPFAALYLPSSRTLSQA